MNDVFLEQVFNYWQMGKVDRAREEFKLLMSKTGKRSSKRTLQIFCWSIRLTLHHFVKLDSELSSSELKRASSAKFTKQVCLICYLYDRGAISTAARILMKTETEFQYKQNIFDLGSKYYICALFSYIFVNIENYTIAEKYIIKAIALLDPEVDKHAIMERELALCEILLLDNKYEQFKEKIQEYNIKHPNKNELLLCYLYQQMLFQIKTKEDLGLELGQELEEKLDELTDKFNSAESTATTVYFFMMLGKYRKCSKNLLIAYDLSIKLKLFKVSYEIADIVKNNFPESLNSNLQNSLYFLPIRLRIKSSKELEGRCLLIKNGKIQLLDYIHTNHQETDFLDLYGGVFQRAGQKFFLTEIQQKCLMGLVSCAEEGAILELLDEIVYESDFVDPKCGIQRITKLVQHLIKMGFDISFTRENGHVLNFSSFNEVILPSDLIYKGHYYYVRKYYPGSFNRSNVEKILNIKKVMAHYYIKSWISHGYIKSKNKGRDVFYF